MEPRRLEYEAFARGRVPWWQHTMLPFLPVLFGGTLARIAAVTWERQFDHSRAHGATILVLVTSELMFLGGLFFGIAVAGGTRDVAAVIATVLNAAGLIALVLWLS